MPRLNPYELNAIAKAILGPIIIGAGMFWTAGTIDWPWGWAMSGLHLTMWIVNTLALASWNRELLAERGRRRADTQGWDKVLLGLFGLTWLAELVLAALDVRYVWTTQFPLWLRPLGALLLVFGFLLLTWSMVVNRHFEPGVRIQRDRAHRVVSSGPYSFVRHPGYTATITAYFLGMPFMLGSWAAAIAAAIGTLALVGRTAKEDALLRRELAGYEAYAARVRYRLLPYVY
jgi:protein-S-isoprenylcysteine O-methyltransferase Ste14